MRWACLLLLFGCASMEAPKAVYIACSAADIVSTVYGLENGFEEGNPLVITDNTATAILSMAVVSLGVGWGLHLIGKENDKSWQWLAVGVPHCAAASYNVKLVSSGGD